MFGRKDVLKLLTSEAILEKADFFITIFIVGPFSITFWKSTWGLMDLYIYPEDPLRSAVVTTAFGIIPGLALYLFQDYFSRKLTVDRVGKNSMFILTRVYTYLGGVINIAACRGVWNLLDIAIPDTPYIIFSTFVSTVAIIYVKALRNVISPPYCLVPDSLDECFEAPTFFKTVRTCILTSAFFIEMQ